MTMRYKKHTGSAEISFEDNTLHGKLLHVRDLVTYEADNPNELEAAFREAVDDYLADCRSDAATQETHRMTQPERDFPYSILVTPAADGGFYATVPDLPGCMGDGPTPVEAVADAIDAAHCWIETQTARGADIPLPTQPI